MRGISAAAMTKGTNTNPMSAVDLCEPNMALTLIIAASDAPAMPAISAKRASGREAMDSRMD